LTRLIHISDLHFGRDRPELVDGLVRFINGAGADAVLVSGDLTQRARHSQFRAARAFLDQLEPQVLCVPGNHDTPLENLFERMMRPFARYRRYIAQDLEPAYEFGAASVIGVNTVDNRAWQRGVFRSRSVRRVCAALQGEERISLVVTHHPLEHRADVGKRLMRGAAKALCELHECGADLVLCGHLHRWRAEPHQAAAGVLLVQAGIGLSSRTRGEHNDLNVLDLSDQEVTITCHVARMDAPDFHPAERNAFRRCDGFWVPLSAETN